MGSIPVEPGRVESADDWICSRLCSLSIAITIVCPPVPYGIAEAQIPDRPVVMLMFRALFARCRVQRLVGVRDCASVGLAACTLEREPWQAERPSASMTRLVLVA